MVEGGAARDDLGMEQEHSTLEDGTGVPVEDPTPTGQTIDDSRPWVRPREGRILAGVAAGIGDRLDVPPWLVRVVFFVAALADGLGIVAYLVAWALMPDQGSSTSIADDARSRLGGLDRPSKVVGVVLIGLGSLIALGTTGLLDSPLLVAFVLAGAGIALIRQG